MSPSGLLPGTLTLAWPHGYGTELDSAGFSLPDTSGFIDSHALNTSDTLLRRFQRLELHVATRDENHTQLLNDILDEIRVLVQKVQGLESQLASIEQIREMSFQKRRIFYRLYTESGPLPSLQPPIPEEPNLGCIDALSVVPPHTGDSIGAAIVSAEKFRTGTRGDPAPNFLLYKHLSDTSAIGACSVSILDAAGAGSTVERTMALVIKQYAGREDC